MSTASPAQARQAAETVEARAALASARITDEQRVALADKLHVLDMATGIDDLLEADIAFHASVAAAAGNPILASLVDTFSARTSGARDLKASVGSRAQRLARSA